MSSPSGAMAKLLFVDLIGSVVWFPIWWYTKGLSMVTIKSVNALRYRFQAYAFRIWIRNFFVPMYGQHDWSGRIVSFFMRLVVLIGRLIALLVEAFVYALGLALWLAAPAILALLTVFSFIAGTVS